MASVEQRFQALIERSKEAIPTHRAPPTIRQIAERKNGPGNIFIIACADSRVDPTTIFKIQFGDAVVLRNAGGRVTDDTFRSLGVMGSITPIGLAVVLHHTDCGGLFRTDEDIRQIWTERSPEHAQEISTKVFGTYRHLGLEECLRQDVAKVQSWPLLPKDVSVVGYSYEVETGRVTQVV